MLVSPVCWYPHQVYLYLSPAVLCHYFTPPPPLSPCTRTTNVSVFLGNQSNTAKGNHLKPPSLSTRASGRGPRRCPACLSTMSQYLNLTGNSTIHYSVSMWFFRKEEGGRGECGGVFVLLIYFADGMQHGAWT